VAALHGGGHPQFAGGTRGRPGNLEDITEQKAAEASLQESEQRLHSILQGSTIPTFVIGRDHRVLFWNRALEELSRIPAREVVGTNQQWRAFYNGESPACDLLVDGDIREVARWYKGKYSKSSS
jgi:PAS domain-containing protein